MTSAEVVGAPGVTPRIGLAPPETATTVRVQDGKTLTTDERVGRKSTPSPA